MAAHSSKTVKSACGVRPKLVMVASGRSGSGWSVKQIGDFNGDGKSDLVWQHSDGTTSLWLMNGLSASSTSGLLGAGSGWSPVP
jgi:hypothetical protein